MIADSRTTGIEVESTLQGDKVAMSIDLSQMGHIMTIMTDLYSDREMAVLREYSTNALDAHREAGQTRPIEVALPTDFKPQLRIRDYGVGLSVDDIHNIYSKYGTSTKRGTNDQVGMLGLGCKSALTYTQQFTVKSVKNGTKVAVSVGREDDGSGSMTILDTSATTDSDGTEIVIPVLRSNGFRAKAERLFRFWEPGTVLVDGKQPTSIREGAMKVTDNIIVCKDGELDENYVVMGNVPYPTKIGGREGLDVELPRDHYAVVFVPIGSVNFAPSREALMDTQTSKATLRAAAAEYKRGIAGVVERAVKNAPTHYAARQAAKDWSAFIGSGVQVTYKGEAIPTALTHPLDGTSWPRPEKGPDRGYEVTSSYYKTKTSAHWTISSNGWDDYLWVHGWDYAKLSPTQHAKLGKYMTDNGIVTDRYNRRPQVVLHPLPFPHAKWIAPERMVDWATIDAIVLPTDGSIPGYKPARKSGSFDCWIDGVWTKQVDANDFSTKHPIYYYSGPQAWWQASRYNDVFVALGGSYTLVTMPSNRRDKFLRDFPTALTVREGVAKLHADWAAKLTSDQQKALAMYDEHFSATLATLDRSKVKDPALQEAIRIAKIDLTKVLESRKVFGRAEMTFKSTAKVKNPLTEYPLFRSDELRKNADHTYWYLNAAFAAK